MPDEKLKIESAAAAPSTLNSQLSTAPHLIHRLDRETSGLVLLAKNSAAARELGKVFETRAVRKEYHAIVHGHVAAEQGTIDAPLGKDEASNIAIKDCVRPDGAAAQTEFFVEQRFGQSGEELKIKNEKLKMPDSPTSPGELDFSFPLSAFPPSLTASARPRRNAVEAGRFPLSAFPPSAFPLSPFTLLRLKPHTGRKHQIRLHLAHLGHPIVGDKIYGGDPDLYLALVEGRLTEAQREKLILPNHALHAGRLTFAWRGREYDFHSPPEPWFTQFIPAGLAM